MTKDRIGCSLIPPEQEFWRQRVRQSVLADIQAMLRARHAGKPIDQATFTAKRNLFVLLRRYG